MQQALVAGVVSGPGDRQEPSWLQQGCNGVKPQSIGRVSGVGLRVAGRMAGKAMSGKTRKAPLHHNRRALPQARLAMDALPARRAQLGKPRAESRGDSAASSKPFRTVGGKIWLKVTGAFFLLPVLVFAPVMWRTRASWQQGPDHRTFLSAAVIIAVFLYLGVSSFWRAGRRR